MKKFLYASLLIVLAVVRASAQNLAAYQAQLSNQNPYAWFKFDGGGLTNALNGADAFAATGGGFTSDAYRNPSNCFTIINSSEGLALNPSTLMAGGGSGPNASSTATGTICFLFRTLDSVAVTGQRFIFSAGNSTTASNGFALFFENTNSSNGDPNSLKLRFGNGTIPIIQASNLLASTWYYLAITYNEGRFPDKAHWYVGPAGGTLTSGQTTNAAEAVAGQGSFIYLGNNETLGTSGFRNPGSGRLDEFAIWRRELTSSEIAAQFAKLPATLNTNGSYAQVVRAEQPTYYFELNNGTLADSMGNTTPLTTNTSTGVFTNDILNTTLSAYAFNQTNDALVTTADLINGGGAGANTLATGKGSLSLLFRMLSDTNNTAQRYIFSQGAGISTTRNQFALYLEDTSAIPPNTLRLKLGNTSTTVLSNAALIANAWYYFAITWDESRNTTEVKYFVGPVGGTLTANLFDPANDSVVGDNGTLYIGNDSTLGHAFRTPGSGVIDEVAIWNEELTTNEITAQFYAATNLPLVTVTQPKLNITVTGNNALLYWTTNNTSAFVLQSAPALSASPAWNSAGTAVVSGTNYVVTNTLTGTNKSFYRLRSP